MTAPAYATLANLAERAPANALNGLLSATQSAALLSASRVADTYFRAGGYVPPLVAFGNDVIDNVCYVAIYNLLYGRGHAAAAATLMYRQRYDDAMRWFKEVAAGLEPDGITDSSTDSIPDELGVFVESDLKRGW